jgi:hypothetical protein
MPCDKELQNESTRILLINENKISEYVDNETIKEGKGEEEKQTRISKGFRLGNKIVFYVRGGIIISTGRSKQYKFK